MTFKIGDRVQWKQREPVACFMPPCDRTPGTIARITAALPGEFRGGFLVGASGLVVSVQHDDSSYPPLDWPAESLEYEDPTKRAQGPGESPGIGTALAVGIGAVGLVGLGLWALGREAPLFGSFSDDDYYKKKTTRLRETIAAGQVPEDLASNVAELRRLSTKFSLPFPSSITDAQLAKAVYFEEGPRAVLNLINTLFDLRLADYRKMKAQGGS